MRITDKGKAVPLMTMQAIGLSPTELADFYAGKDIKPENATAADLLLKKGYAESGKPKTKAKDIDDANYV